MTTPLTHMRSPHWALWIASAAILALAAVLRMWALGRPDTLVFDELYYVRDAVSQLAHGFPTTWPDDEPEFGWQRAQTFSDEASTIAHPPLGKWLIGLGILAFGPDGGLGWRAAVAVAGVLTVALTMCIAWVLTRSEWATGIAGLLLAVDGVHVVLSRVALLDGLLTLFVVLGALCVALCWRETRLGWARWRWVLGAGVAFGAASAIKWSGLFALAAFLLLLTLADLLRRLRAAEDRPWRGATLRGLATAAVALPAAGVAYLASWLGWIVSPGANSKHEGEPWWVSLWGWHVDSLSWHSTLDAAHPYQAHPLTWPLGLRPTSMYRAADEGAVAAITPLPNPIVTWLGVVALAILLLLVTRAVVAAARMRDLSPLDHSVWVGGFVLAGYLSGWLPWVMLFSRSAVFQFYAVVLTPFAALALAVVLASFASLPGSGITLRLDASGPAVQGRRIAVGMVLGAAVIMGLLFWPLWSGQPVPDWFYEAHRWLPGWV